MKKIWLMAFCLALTACSTSLQSLEPADAQSRPLDIPPQADELPN